MCTAVLSIEPGLPVLLAGVRDELTDRAAALTYYGVLAIFPALIALVSIVGAFAIGSATTTGILVTAVVAVILGGVWIVLVSLFLWRDPELALPRGWHT